MLVLQKLENYHPQINYNDTTATATGLIIPAYSQITEISIFVETLFANSSTTTLALGDGSDNATDCFRFIPDTAPLRMLQSNGDRWHCCNNGGYLQLIK